MNTFCRILLVLSVVLIPCVGRGANGDYLFTKEKTSGPGTLVRVTPNGTDLLGWQNGTLVNVARSSVGSISSLTLTLPAIFTVTGSPLTTSGTLAATLATQTANRVWAGPTTGAAAAPTFRTLVAADVPSLSSIYLPLAGGTMTGALQLGADANANIAEQIIQAGAGITGANRDGGNIVLKAGDSTGSGDSAVKIFTTAAGDSGTAVRTSVERVRIDSTGVYIMNTTAPITNPDEGGFILYVDPGDGSLRARGPNGTITILANP